MTIEAFNKIVDALADKLYRFALKQARDETLASDVVQESFEVLWRQRKKIQKEKARTYLFSTAHNLIVDYFRSIKRKAEYEEVDTNAYYYCQEYKGAKEFIDHLLDHLPSEQKSVLILRDYEGYSYREIGEITNLDENRVKVYIHRARKYLRYYVGKMDNLI